MNKIRVIFRLDRNPYIGHDECIALFPDIPAPRGYIAYIAPKEGMNTMSLQGYWGTKVAKPSDYKGFLEELKNSFLEKDEVLGVQQRLNRKVLEQAWLEYDGKWR